MYLKRSEIRDCVWVAVRRCLYTALFVASSLFWVACEKETIIETVKVREEVSGTFSILIPWEWVWDSNDFNSYYYSNEYCDGIKVQLVQNNTVIQEVYSENEKFSFKNVPYGIYNIVFRISDEVCHTIADIKIDETLTKSLRFEGIFEPVSNILRYSTSVHFDTLSYMYCQLRRNLDIVFFLRITTAPVNVTYKRFTLQGELLEEGQKYVSDLFAQRYYFKNPTPGVLPLSFNKPELFYITYMHEGKKYYAHTVFNIVKNE